jgi:hypothetical protein
MVEQYCFECHNRDDWAGGRAFDVMSPDRIAAEAETWEAAIRKLRGGLMPPAGERRPDSESVAQLVSWLESEIDTEVSQPPAGRVSLRRLNRREYAYAIRDLLALNVDAKGLLPDDNTAGYFDNNADALQVSPAFVDQYIDAARAIALEERRNRTGARDSRRCVGARGGPGRHVAPKEHRAAPGRACNGVRDRRSEGAWNNRRG